VEQGLNTDARHDPGFPPVTASPLGHRLMFLLLALLAFALFAPTVLVPVLREHGDLLVEKDRLERHLADLNRDVLHRAQLADQFMNDPEVVERLAVLDLGYRRPGEEIFDIELRELPAVEPEESPPPLPRGRIVLPAEWPAWAHQAHAWADATGLVDLFLDSTLRPVFLLMSAGLLIAAFVLYAPVPQPPEAADAALSNLRVAHDR
jgi:hypothetical protein